MSSILKALKKLETENATRQHDLPKIDTEILRNNIPERSFPIKAILVGVFLFICGGGITYVYLMQGREVSSSPATRVQINPSPKTTLPSSSPLPVEIPVERIEPETIVGASSEPDIKPNRAAQQRTVVTRVEQIQSKKQRTQELAKKNPQSIAEKQKMTNGSHSSTALQIPALRVNGIAFQDGVDSVAVVNGVPVSRGASIEGVKVDEIQRDRILFSYGEEKFTIQLGKSNR